MSDQYVAADKRTGLEVSITGNFPDQPQDRIRIARTANLFTRLTSTILEMEHESERREAFIAVETQMELADALIRRDGAEVQRLLEDTLKRMGVSPDQMRDIEDEIRRRLGDLGGDLPPIQDLPRDEPPRDEPPGNNPLGEDSPGDEPASRT